MRKAIKFCKKHQIKKIKIGKAYCCKLCRKEYANEYREKNRELIKQKNKIYNQKTRERRQSWIKQDRIDDPERYKKYANDRYKVIGKNFQTRRILRKYKLTIEQYNKMLVDQKNRCAICNEEETRKSKTKGQKCRLSIDHNHKNNIVRELLCHRCNAMLGHARDSILLLKQAILYLEKHEHTAEVTK